MKEKERKFELKYLPKGLTRTVIEQGYLILADKKHLRVRITNKSIAELGFKTIINKKEKEEYEYQIPLSDGRELMRSTKIKLKKTRYKTSFEGNSVDIDVFSNGVSWVEIEYEKTLKKLPDFCGKELTGIKRYSNIFIALQNSKSKNGIKKNK
jgi:CYTH domain-containing protein